MSDLPDDPQTRTALADHAARLKHDLGKYVAMQQRWLGPEPATDALREALTSDLLSTRRGPDGTLSAVEVWAEFRGALHGEAPLGDGSVVDLSDAPEVQRIDAGMAVVTEVVAALQSEGGLDEAGVQRGHQAASEVAEGCRDLARRLATWVRRVDG